MSHVWMGNRAKDGTEQWVCDEYPGYVIQHKDGQPQYQVWSVWADDIIGQHPHFATAESHVRHNQMLRSES